MVASNQDSASRDMGTSNSFQLKDSNFMASEQLRVWNSEMARTSISIGTGHHIVYILHILHWAVLDAPMGFRRAGSARMAAPMCACRSPSPCWTFPPAWIGASEGPGDLSAWHSCWPCTLALEPSKDGYIDAKMIKGSFNLWNFGEGFENPPCYCSMIIYYCYCYYYG